MGWQEFLASGVVIVCVWLLGRKLLGKSKSHGACEHCAPAAMEKKSRDEHK